MVPGAVFMERFWLWFFLALVLGFCVGAAFFLVPSLQCVCLDDLSVRDGWGCVFSGCSDCVRSVPGQVVLENGSSARAAFLDVTGG